MAVGVLPVRHDPASAALVRHEIAADLARRSLDPESIDDIVLVVSELVTNAIRHTEASEQIHVSWELAGASVLVRVEDGSTVQPEPRSAGARQADGRGLAIVAAIAADWGVETSGAGKCVWARVAVRPARR